MDKLLIAKLLGQAPQQFAELQPHVPDSVQSLHNIVMWLVTDNNYEKRLKDLVTWSSLQNAHEKVNSAHEDDHAGTAHCELLSNEVTRVRVLDVPGFFGVKETEDVCDLSSCVSEGKTTDLSTMRKILRIKSTHNLKFKRIVYFLPVRGALIRTDRVLITELGIMKEYFGRPIFDSMVVIATLPPEVYNLIEDKGQDLFPKLQQTREHLKEALKKVFRSEDIPEPPIVFISLFDTCDKILEKIQKAEVKQDSLNLEFQRYLCARCDVHIISEGASGARVFSCALPEHRESISGEESSCHPMMIPKYSKVKKFFGGIAHLITFRRFVGKWPNFENMDEVCINCNESPNTRGCIRVGEEYRCGEESFTVAHSASALERYQIEVEDDKEEQAKDPCQDEAMQEAPREHQGASYVSQEGREANGQEIALQEM